MLALGFKIKELYTKPSHWLRVWTPKELHKDTLKKKWCSITLTPNLGGPNSRKFSAWYLIWHTILHAQVQSCVQKKDSQRVVLDPKFLKSKVLMWMYPLIEYSSQNTTHAQESTLKLNSIELSMDHEAPQRGTKPWFWSFFEKIFYSKLVSSSCIGAYFESWVKLLGPPLSTSQTLRKS